MTAPGGRHMTQHSDQGGNRPTERRPSASSTERDTAATASTSSSAAPGDAGRPGIVDQAREQASNLASQATQQTAELAGQASAHVNTLVKDQKQRAAERLGTLSGALREAARKLGHDDVGRRVGQYAHRAADQVDSMSSYIRGAELQTFVRDTGQFARRRPEVFI